MLEVYERLGTHCHHKADSQVVLTHEQRDRGRLKLVDDQGQEVRVFLERGKPLLVGEYLKTTCGHYIQVAGAIEPVALASCDAWHKKRKEKEREGEQKKRKKEKRRKKEENRKKENRQRRDKKKKKR
eukprot:gnl/Carplike_NY0171/27953_a55760_54.p1 GENE.gnl/Carplike_NY0171/27953_a55760_54~~gnl/Carplike_NY0171/27953_a55760_54.p1  ORF type:complete len:127 (-),score=19.72 gnl/Carplike_NY0171/27953_a55760_54:31-411(-)